jgi:polyhydroxyalkanoate synthesis repressor PhaR
MPAIKRYPNRKLYNTEAKEYITLEGIAELIRQGEEIQVVDHATGQDLTALTLTQIILEQEKKRRGFLPQSVLTGLIQAGGERLSTLRHALATPLDLARQVDEEIEGRLQALINRGELAADEGRRLRDELLALNSRSPGRSRFDGNDLERLLEERGVPSQDDLQQVLEQLQSLVDKLDGLAADEKPTAEPQSPADSQQP